MFQLEMNSNFYSRSFKKDEISKNYHFFHQMTQHGFSIPEAKCVPTTFSKPLHPRQRNHPIVDKDEINDDYLWVIRPLFVHIALNNALRESLHKNGGE